MGCPKLEYNLSTEPRLRCVYNAADREENRVIHPTTDYPPVAEPAIWQVYTAESDQPRLYVPEYRLYIVCGETDLGVYRYSYCLNNPLIYTDPDGEIVWLVPALIFIGKAALVGAAINGGIYAVSTAVTGQQWDWGQFGKSAAIGAISGVASAGAGVLASGLQVYGAIPGALVKGGIQGLAGGISGGFGNVIMQSDWNAFGKGFAQGFGTGFIMGGISGGIEGYKNAQGIGANKWTGRLYTDETTYNATLKQGIPLQPNPERDCYGYALEYADAGRGNKDAAYFLGEANNAPGAYAGDVAKKSGIKVNYSQKISGSEWHNVGGALSTGKEILGTTSRDGVNHWVNLTGVTTANKLRVVGGGFKTVLRSSTVWDPIRGHVNGPNSFFTILSLF